MESRAQELTTSAAGGARYRPWAKRLAIGTAGVLVVGELAVRAVGLVDFPLYDVDPATGYHYRADQSGRFLNRNAWSVNARSMPTSRPWAPDRALDVVLIGNSIVAGGNPYDQAEKISPLLERLASDRFAVWPVAAGGWSTVNEVAFLEHHPDVVAATDFFIWSHVSGGLASRAGWLGERVFPTERPRWATAFVIDRYVLPRLGLSAAAEPSGEAIYAHPGGAREQYRENLRRFDKALGALAQASSRRTPGILLLYPDRDQLRIARQGGNWLPERDDLVELAEKHRLLIVDPTQIAGWNPQHYRDVIHPTADGNLVLARILLDALTRAFDE